jgi:GNAT superfamily N-acetyltransferase
MLEPVQLRGKICPKPMLAVGECTHRQPDFFKFLYATVGQGYGWRERLAWSDSQWSEHVTNENMRTCVAYQQKSIAGYFELTRQDGDVEIKYFGLTSDFIGKGYGGYMLTEAIRQACDWGAKRVWVHTCTLDHKDALSNYLARGMKIYKTVTIEDEYESES